MLNTTESILTHEQPSPSVHVLRFIRPDLRRELDPIADDDTPLCRALMSCLEDLGEGQHVVLNFAIIERFPTSFFQVLLRVRQFVRGRQGQIYLCGFRPEIRNAVELMGGARLFTLVNDEAQALDLIRREAGA
jgi:anti-anti-sigma regulatory factor